MTDKEMINGNNAVMPKRTDEQLRDRIAKAVAEKRIEDWQGETLFKLHKYGQTQGLSDAALAREINVSSGTISTLFNCTYGAENWSNMIAEIEEFLKVEDARSSYLKLGFVLTQTAKAIFTACDGARLDGMPAFVYGSSQIGKTTALTAYQSEHGRGHTKYLRLGARWTKARLVRELALACGLKNSRGMRSWEVEEKILQTLTRNDLLIIDEFHMAMETVCDATSRELVEYIREVFDRSGCGLVLASTKVGKDDFEQGKNSKLFDQMRRRGVIELVLPDWPTVKDINLIAKHFGLELPKGDLLALIKQLLKTRGLGVFVKYLQKAHALASSGKAAHDMTWDDFEYVYNGYAKLADMENEY